MTLKELKAGETAVIKTVGGSGALRQHFLDMGVIPGAKVKLTKFAPMGDPMELLIHGYSLTLRLADAAKIKIDKPYKEINSENGSFENSSDEVLNVDHPGLGETGKFHVKEGENPLPKDAVLTFALAGNQNCGKTTLFNQLTGSNQHVGNFPGVTVDRKSGSIKEHPNTLVTDLPGIYSLSPYTAEEIVSRQFILDEHPTGIINIVDATNIERNLYLTLQLMELDVPMVLALNMMDEVKGNGGTIKINAMEEMLGIPVVPISANKNEGVHELIEHAMHVAKYQERPGRTDFCDKDTDAPVHRAIHSVMHLIEDHAEKKNIPVRFAATKIVEGDELILKQLDLSKNEQVMLEYILLQLEEERGLDHAAAIADMRFSFIKKLCRRTVVKPHESKELKRSRKIDQVLTGKYTAIPFFIGIMGLVFFLTFNVIGAFFQELLEKGIDYLVGALDALMTKTAVNEVLHSLVIDGICAGVGSVLSFLPIIVTLFFFLSLLEDSGYIARVAFFMDKLLRKIGLSGRSIVPLLIGFGCTVPAVMATRTLPSKRDRNMTILLTPFMSCTAKLPIYAFFISMFFPKYGGFMMTGLYIFSIIIGIFVAFLFKGTLFKGEPVPFVMELPNYRLPTVKNTCQLLWEKAKDFLYRAFTVIFIATIVIWFLQSFDLAFNMTTDIDSSILAKVAGFIAPIFAPIGLGDWRLVTALVTGVMAKESVVSTLEILFASVPVSQVLSVPSALSMLVFCLLYVPCVAAIASIKRELGTKAAGAVVVWQCAVAWLCALIVYLIALIV
ncbi:ferrous iron transport protein B [Treponema sp.]|uniref:ferrous iron transport protein B n=1 Tax=Treponema sp. TaxID=166 RepID=UPI00298D71F2|nr:ferrous iron transport protein B [Treponema sp.]MCR5613891.1 ferrous iron transport protein B [Treponema sp.]